MEKKKIRIESIIKTDSVHVAVIVEMIINWYSKKRGALFFGRKQPLYIVNVNVAGQKRILRLNGEELSREGLLEECPQILPEFDELV